MKRLLTGALAVAMAVSFVAPSIAGAATVADIQAQIALLTQQLAALSGGSASAGTTFTVDLTVGSRGADVTALQTWLIGKGFSIPAGATGYFGAQTKAAVSAWQASVGITPTAGYFGPISRAKVNGMVVTVPGTPGTSTNCPTGWTCTSNGGITTPGVEGTLTVTSAPISGGTLYEGDSKGSVLAFKAKAQNSDIAIQRIKLDLGTATTIYNKIYQKVYVVDENGNTLAWSDLNSSTVVKDGSNYYITLSGFSYVVPKDSTKTLTIKMDVRSSIDSTDIDTETYTVRLAANGVRGMDGAGIDQYSPVAATDVTKTMTISANLADSASLTLSANVNNPLSRDVIAADGANNNELDKVTLLTFDIKAEKDTVLLTDLVATITRSAGAATASSSYLYVGDVQIGSASVSGSTATFTDIDYTIPKDTTKTFTLKADIRGATAVVTTIDASVANSGLTAENMVGDSVSKSGSADANNLYVRFIGPEFTLVSSSASRTSVSSNDTTGVATSTGSATFNLNIKAVGGAISFGSVGSTTPMFATTTAANGIAISKNGATAVALSSLTAAGTSAVISYSANPTGSTADTEGFTVPEGATVSLPVTASLTITGNSSNNYAFQLNGVRWYTAAAGQQTSTSMLDQAAWRTSSITLP